MANEIKQPDIPQIAELHARYDRTSGRLDLTLLGIDPFVLGVVMIEAGQQMSAARQKVIEQAANKPA